VDGPLWVDTICISCDTCRWMSSDKVFRHEDGMSAVVQQPETEEEMQEALRILNACPVGSIHFDNANPADRQHAAMDFPRLVPEAETLGLEVYHLGHHSPLSFGATPWAVRHPETGIVAIIDCPRYSTGLKKSLEKHFGEGKVKYMFLTHADDVADHVKWAEKLGVKRIIHESEAHADMALAKRAAVGMEDCEIRLSGHGPWDPFAGELGANSCILFQPGHSIGSCVLHFQPGSGDDTVAAVFTGDHLAKLRVTGTLDAFLLASKFDYKVQLESLRAWAADGRAQAVNIVFPGHGRVWTTESFPQDLEGVCDRLEGWIADGSVSEIQTSN